MYRVEVKAIGGWTTHSTHQTLADAVDQADMVHGRIAGNEVDGRYVLHLEGSGAVEVVIVGGRVVDSTDVRTPRDGTPIAPEMADQIVQVWADWAEVDIDPACVVVEAEDGNDVDDVDDGGDIEHISDEWEVHPGPMDDWSVVRVSRGRVVAVHPTKRQAIADAIERAAEDAADETMEEVE